MFLALQIWQVLIYIPGVWVSVVVLLLKHLRELPGILCKLPDEV
jgi:hypothetical protein